MRHSKHLKQAEAILFDLDGTLLDTAPEFVDCLNKLLISENHVPLPEDKIRQEVSHGIAGLLKLAFNYPEHTTHYLRLKEKLLDYYFEQLGQKTVFFPGMLEVINYLTIQNIPWGIVTNKSSLLTHRLLENINLDKKIPCIICGDTLSTSKPDPAPLLYACDLLKINPLTCLYVGDAERDIIAGRRSGMKTVAALYGYIPERENPENWGADYSINYPTELIQFTKNSQ